jgi:hypothetical protein
VTATTSGLVPATGKSLAIASATTRELWLVGRTVASIPVQWMPVAGAATSSMSRVVATAVRPGRRMTQRASACQRPVSSGGLSIAAVRDLLAAAESPATSLHDALGKAQYATTPRVGYQASDASRQAGARQAAELIDRRGWQVRPDSPARELLAGVLAALRELGQDDLLTLADAYAGPAEEIAAADLAAVLRRATLDSRLEGVIIGTVLGDTLLASLRRLAEEDASGRAYSDGIRPDLR